MEDKKEKMEDKKGKMERLIKSLGLWCIGNITDGSAPYKKKSINTTKLI